MSRNAGEKFSVEEDEILINFVSDNPIIYDMSNGDYKNSYKREKAWEEVAKIINKTSKACKNRWKNIKDTYYRQKKKKSGTGSAAHPRSKFESYRLQLSFLDSVSQERTSISTVNNKHSQSSSDMPSPGTSHRDEVEATTEPTDMTDPENSLNPPENHLLGDSTDSVKTSKRPRKNKDNILMYLKKRDESRQKLLQNFLSLSSRNSCNSDDEIDLFTRQANSVLKKLPSYLQIKAMQELFETLTKYKMLAVESHCGMYSPSSTSSTSGPRRGTGESSASYNNINSPINAGSPSQVEPADLSSRNMQCPPISAVSTGQEEPADLPSICVPCPPISAVSTGQEKPADLSSISMPCPLISAVSTGQEEPADLSSINMLCLPISAATTGQEEPTS